MKETSKVVKAFILILQIGLTMLVSIGLCGAIGYYIDNRFGTSLMIFFIAFGVICGYSGTYSLIKQHIDMRSSHDRYEQMFAAWDEQEANTFKKTSVTDDVLNEGDDGDEN